MSTKQRHLQDLLVRAKKVTWYPGHMQKSLRLMQERLTKDQIGCMLEVRDSRVPLSSLNYRFEQYLFSSSGSVDGQAQQNSSGKKCSHKNGWGEQVGQPWTGVHRITVFNKTDMVDSPYALANFSQSKSAVDSDNQEPEWRQLIRRNSKYPVVFAACETPFSSNTGQVLNSTANQILEQAVGNWLSLHRDKMSSMPNCPYPPLNIMVIGLPNTGKSSLINLLRSRGLKGTHSSSNDSAAVDLDKDVCGVGKLPGHTRSVSSKIKVIDTETISLSSTSVSQANDLMGSAAEKKRLELPIVQNLRRAGIRLKVYVMDSPGILQPHFVDPVSVIGSGDGGALGSSGVGLETGIKLGLVGCMPTDLGGRRGVCPLIVAEYLWFRISERWNGLKDLVGDAYQFPVSSASQDQDSPETKRHEFTRFLQHYYREEVESKSESVSIRRSDDEKMEIAAESFIRAWRDGDLYRRIELFPSSKSNESRTAGNARQVDAARRKMANDMWRLTLLDDEFMTGSSAVAKWFKDRYDPGNSDSISGSDNGGTAKIPISIAGSSKIRVGDLYMDKAELMSAVERRKLKKKQQKVRK